MSCSTYNAFTSILLVHLCSSLCSHLNHNLPVIIFSAFFSAYTFAKCFLAVCACFSTCKEPSCMCWITVVSCFPVHLRHFVDAFAHILNAIAFLSTFLCGHKRCLGILGKSMHCGCLALLCACEAEHLLLHAYCSTTLQYIPPALACLLLSFLQVSLIMPSIMSSSKRSNSVLTESGNLIKLLNISSVLFVPLLKRCLSYEVFILGVQ